MTQTEALLAIAKRDGGVITPAAVLAEAEDPNSVLHGAFTWDDAAAAKKWRTLEAQRLIRECRIVVEKPNGKKVDTYAFVGLSADRDGASADNPYRLACDVSRSPDLLAIAENDALSQLVALKRRFAHLKRLQAVWDEISKLAGD